MSQAGVNSVSSQSGVVFSVTGTANEVTVTPTTGNVVVSTPSTFIAPGSIESTTTLKSDGIFTAASGQVVKITSPGAYPYTTLSSDYVIIVDTTSARTINLIASPTTGQTYRIKDNTGNAASNNITIIPASGNIDGSGSYVISANWGSVDVSYNGSFWITL
jgi:hypothetical protein